MSERPRHINWRGNVPFVSMPFLSGLCLNVLTELNHTFLTSCFNALLVGPMSEHASMSFPLERVVCFNALLVGPMSEPPALPRNPFVAGFNALLVGPMSEPMTMTINPTVHWVSMPFLSGLCLNHTHRSPPGDDETFQCPSCRAYV